MRYFIGFLVTVLLIVLLIFMLFQGGDNKAKVPATTKTLDSYAITNAEVRMTVDGPVNASQEHQQSRITVSRDNVVYEQLRGYDGSVTSQKSFPNTQKAYESFLHALSAAGFTKGNTAENLRDERGQCPLGERYVFELRQNDENLQRFWTTSCGNPKTYLGNRALTIDLFRNQIPGYNDLTDQLPL